MKKKRYISASIFPRTIKKPVTETRFLITVRPGFVVGDSKTVKDVADMKRFFEAIKGRTQGFRFKDWK